MDNWHFDDRENEQIGQIRRKKSIKLWKQSELTVKQNW